MTWNVAIVSNAITITTEDAGWYPIRRPKKDIPVSPPIARRSVSMRVWAFKIHDGDIFGRFSVHRDFKIYVDWMPRSASRNRWKVHVSLSGMHEFGYGSTLASALVALYTVVSENYASTYEYQKYLQASYMIHRRT